MMDLYLYNLNDYAHPIKASDVFGSDTDKLFEACKKVLHDILYKYEGCYVSPEKPRLSEFVMLKKQGMEGTYRNFLQEWALQYPEEAAKEFESRKNWEMEHEKQFRIIFGIAKRHHVRLDWCGGKGQAACCPDEWIIRKNGKRLAMIKL